MDKTIIDVKSYSIQMYHNNNKTMTIIIKLRLEKKTKEMINQVKKLSSLNRTRDFKGMIAIFKIRH